MKKKYLLLTPLMALLLTGCVLYNGQGKPGKQSKAPDSGQSADSGAKPSSGAPTSQDGGQSSQDVGTSQAPVSGEDLPVGTAVKVYLVFGEYGKYKGNLVNTGVDRLFLEHTIEYDAKVGDNLPGATDITSAVNGSKFLCWTAYNNDGKLTSYYKVPAVHDKILYASFSDGSGQGSSSSDPSSSSSSSPQEKVTINFIVDYDAGMGVGIYLVGDFCEWSPANALAVKFECATDGHTWTATREVIIGTVYNCKLVTAAYESPSSVYVWEKDGTGNERSLTFNASADLNLVWGNY